MCQKVARTESNIIQLGHTNSLCGEGIWQNSSNKGLTRSVIRKPGIGHKLHVFYEQKEDKWDKNQGQQEGDWQEIKVNHMRSC